MSVPVEEMRRRVPVAPPAVQQLALPPPAAATLSGAPAAGIPAGQVVTQGGSAPGSVGPARVPAAPSPVTDTFGGEAGRASRAATLAQNAPQPTSLVNRPPATIYAAPNSPGGVGVQLQEAGNRARSAAQAMSAPPPAAPAGAPPPAAATAAETAASGGARAGSRIGAAARALGARVAPLARGFVPASVAYNALTAPEGENEALLSGVQSAPEAVARTVASYLPSALTLGAVSPRDVSAGIEDFNNVVGRNGLGAFTLPRDIRSAAARSPAQLAVPQDRRGWLTNFLVNNVIPDDVRAQFAGPSAPASAGSQLADFSGVTSTASSTANIVNPDGSLQPRANLRPGDKNTFTFSDGRTVDVNSYQSPAVVGRMDPYTGSGTPSRGGAARALGGPIGASIGAGGDSTIQRIDKAISAIGPLDRRGRRQAVSDLLSLRNRVESGDADRASVEQRSAADLNQRTAASELAAEVNREQIAAQTANQRRQTTQTVTDASGTTYAVDGTTLTPLTTPDGQPFRAASRADTSLRDQALKFIAEAGAMGTPPDQAAQQFAQGAQAWEMMQMAPPGTVPAGTQNGVPVYRDANGNLIAPSK